MPRDDDRNDDDDDRPRRRRPRDDDDDREPRPAKSGGPNVLLIVLVVLGVVGGVGVLGCAGLAFLLTSATAKVRQATTQMVSQNNMKQIGLGMHSVHDVTNSFQGPYAQGVKPGDPSFQGHSFRVGLLPYIEQDSLYRRIDLTQPWDSGRNAPTTSTPVVTYLDLANPASVGTATPYRLFVGPGALFDGTAKMPTMMSVTDGTSNTILLVSATQTVPWAKPQELPYGPGVPIPPLGGDPKADGFNALFADGSVRYIKRTITDANLRSLIEKADGKGAGIE